MSDIFDNTIFCKDCNCKMQRVQFIKNGFTFRALQCQKCNNRILHPEDQLEYERYINLRNKHYSVKLRMVGNSYTVSIPKEIINFINEQNKMMDELVSLSFEKMGKIVLIFDNLEQEHHERENEEKQRQNNLN